MLIDYAKCRKNMAECQLEPGNVTSPEILAAFEKVPREQFLPGELRPVAYVDEDLRLPGGGFLMEPLVFARMLQAASPRPSDIALNIGDITGYAAAVLSELVTTIVALESEPGMFDRARVQWAAMDFCNIAVLQGNAPEGCPKHAPYNLIVVNGAVESVPDAMKRQLAIGGRLVTVVRERKRPFGRLTLIQRDSEAAFSRQSLYDAATPYLSGFAPQEAFVF